MRNVFFNLTLTIILFSGCTSQNVVKFNDTIVKANEDLRVASENFSKKMASVTNSNYAALEPERLKLSTLMEKEIATVAALKLKSDMPGAEDFKNAFIDYYKFEKDIFDNEYKNICLINGSNDEGKLREILTEMKEKVNKEETMEKNIHTQQTKFAEQNKMKINN